MDRRLIGALVLVVAVVAALAGNSRTKVLSGSVARGPIPGPPSVGTCVIGPYDFATLASSDSSEPGYATAETGACTGEHYGEVVAIIPAGLDYRPPFDSGSQVEPDPDDPWTPCWAEVSSFLGYETGPLEPMPRDRWWPTVAVGPELIAPNFMQRADGQRWLACVAIGISDGVATAYTGSLAGVMTTLRAPPSLAVCLDDVPSADQGGGIAPCERPHLAEQFAAIYPDQDHPDPVPSKDDCERLIRAMTGMPDPSAGGRLDITVTAVNETFYWGDDPEEPKQFSGTSRFCLLVARDGVSLTGPLLGLGDDAVPIG